MKNTNKKGFTIVELAIVIAVIAILAAVLIPTFSGIIAKSKLSADQKALHDMNTAIAMESATTLDAAMTALEKHGINASNLVPVSKGYSFIWNNETKKIDLVKSEDKVNITDSYKELVTVVASADAFVDAIKNDFKYIKLDADVTLGSAPINVEGKITIDLNGKKLDASASTRPFNMGEGADLTIDAEGSTINCGLYGLANFNGVNATLTVNGGTFTGDLEYGAFIKIRPLAGDVKVTLNNVNYTDISTDSYIVNCNGATGNVEIVINGGSYKSALGIQADKATVDGATIVTEAYAVHASKSLIVKNADITSNGKYEKDLTNNGSMPAACVGVEHGGEATVTNSKLTYNKYNAATSQGAAVVVASSGGKIVVDGATTITGVEYLDTVTEDKYNSYIEIAGVKVN